MDIVNLIITAMLVCAAACAIVLVWPTREPRDRAGAGPGAAVGASASPADGADSSAGSGGAAG